MLPLGSIVLRYGSLAGGATVFATEIGHVVKYLLDRRFVLLDALC